MVGVDPIRNDFIFNILLPMSKAKAMDLTGQLIDGMGGPVRNLMSCSSE